MEIETGIRVEWLNEPQCIRMIWGHNVNERDVKSAFAQIQALLDEVSEPRCVLVDLSSEPNMPLGATVQNALWGPYRHPRLRTWLIIESRPNRVAHVAEKFLSGATGRQNVLWFTSEAEALDAVHQGLLQ
ncbi:MAG: hypothetical protein KC547_18575 [Anaerolineae bacterium]|nr:hypothetical protein [Anaerolineae bacterium]MCA9909138.1 hypothetical protein [Anaerolineae bacterium]